MFCTTAAYGRIQHHIFTPLLQKFLAKLICLHKRFVSNMRALISCFHAEKLQCHIPGCIASWPNKRHITTNRKLRQIQNVSPISTRYSNWRKLGMVLIMRWEHAHSLYLNRISSLHNIALHFPVMKVENKRIKAIVWVRLDAIGFL